MSESLRKTNLDDFLILKVIGRGVMGKVMLVRHKINRKLYALKSIHKQWILSHGQVQHAQSERAILTAFSDSFFNLKCIESGEEFIKNNPHNQNKLENFLIKLHASFQTSSEIFYVLDFMVGGDLASILARESRLEERRVKFLTAEIAVGLNFLHEKGIVYRDLKPENVLLDARGHVVLTDFGLSKIVANRKTNTFCGTAEYLAPEILRGESYDQSVDWWSFGTMLYEMIAGITPYWSESATEMYRRILYEPFIEFPTYMSVEARSIISKLLTRRSWERINFEDIKRDPFFSSLNWHEIESRRLPSPMSTEIRRNEEDTSAFDIEFTKMQPAITPVDSETVRLLSRPESQEPFCGFSYYPDFSD